MGTVSMLGGLFQRNSRKAAGPPPPVPKVVEPPLIPSQEKRLEKERRWMESISSRSISASASTAHPPLPPPVEFIKRDPNPKASGSLSAGSQQSDSTNGLLSRWNTSHRRGNTAASSSASSAAVTSDNRSLRTTRSASTLASKMGLGRRSRERERQKSSCSSVLSDCTAAPAHPHTPPLLQLGAGGEDAAATFVHVPQFSPSSALLAPPSSSSHSPSTYFSSHRNHHGSSTSQSSPRHGANISHTLAPTSSRSQIIQTTSSSAQPRLSSTETTTTLAARLKELEHANNVGLLDAEEYRVLRQNLFEKNVAKPHNWISHHPLPAAYGHEAVTSASQDPPQRTGTLLGLPRLNMADGDTRAEAVQAPILNTEADPSISLLHPPSSDSIHSKKSRFSLRSTRSNLTARSGVSQMSRLFRRASTSAPPPSSSFGGEAKRSSRMYHEEDGARPPLPTFPAARIEASIALTVNGDDGSIHSKPASIGRRLTKKGSIPSDWKELQNLHAIEKQREDAQLAIKSTDRERNARASILLADLENAEEEVDIKAESRYRTMRRSSISVGASEPASYSSHNRNSVVSTQAPTKVTKRFEPPEPSLPPGHGRQQDAKRQSQMLPFSSRNHSDTCTETPRASMYEPYDLNNAATASASILIVQPGDELLDSTGLREAIASLKEENHRLLRQFQDLQVKLHEKYGDPALDAVHAQAKNRRESVSLLPDTGRRMSTSSSLFSSQGRNSVLGGYSGHAGLVPGASLSRRPSKASSIASSSIRRGLNSSGSTQPGSVDTHLTSRPPSTVQEELLFTAVDAEIVLEGLLETSQYSQVKDPQCEKEQANLQARKRNIEERYAARLEYLEARLQGQLNKEKLRR